jgi:hypothetical protein
MKNQYFGDVNDYRKYGLLRALIAGSEITTTICWMLTPDDGRPDGKLTTYLMQPERWRHFDPELLDTLQGLVRDERSVAHLEKASLLPRTRFYNEILPDDHQGRQQYFAPFWPRAQNSDLIFFDPDNGVEVKSKPLGRKGSSKYLYWRELTQAFSGGSSVLVYQHFPREKRTPFIARVAKEMDGRTEAPCIYSFRTSHVVFFLLLSELSRPTLELNILRVSETWVGQIEVHKHKG